jgi:hypothetical protein
LSTVHELQHINNTLEKSESHPLLYPSTDTTFCVITQIIVTHLLGYNFIATIFFLLRSNFGTI